MWFSFQPACTDIYDDGIWLGATDLTTEGTFIWESSGNLLTYKNWAVGQPNDSGQNEDCIHMWCLFKNGEWNDAPCDYISTPQTSMCEVIFPCS